MHLLCVICASMCLFVFLLFVLLRNKKHAFCRNNKKDTMRIKSSRSFEGHIHFSKNLYLCKLFGGQFHKVVFRHPRRYRAISDFGPFCQIVNIRKYQWLGNINTAKYKCVLQSHKIHEKIVISYVLFPLVKRVSFICTLYITFVCNIGHQLFVLIFLFIRAYDNIKTVNFCFWWKWIGNKLQIYSIHIIAQLMLFSSHH